MKEVSLVLYLSQPLLIAFPGALYPPQFFGAFLSPLHAEVQVLLSTLLSFLARLTAHATSSGLTPPALSGLFGPLLFGLGSASLPFHHTYGAYLRCSHATEHLLLAYIRTQDAATSRAVGLPSRLKDWIRGYPAMIPPMEKLDKARRGARTVRITSVRRNVRLYSHDLVKTAASWCAKGEQGNLCSSKEWTRVMGPPNAKLVPRYSDPYRKRLEIPSGSLPDLGFDGTLTQSSSGSSPSSDEMGLLGKEEEKRFRSLTDLKWGEFESLGFGGGDEKRLEFDLNEGARTVGDGQLYLVVSLIFRRHGVRSVAPSHGTTFPRAASLGMMVPCLRPFSLPHQ